MPRTRRKIAKSDSCTPAGSCGFDQEGTELVEFTANLKAGDAPYQAMLAKRRQRPRHDAMLA
jgi:hypothetical protein